MSYARQFPLALHWACPNGGTTGELQARHFSALHWARPNGGTTGELRQLVDQRLAGTCPAEADQLCLAGTCSAETLRDVGKTEMGNPSCGESGNLFPLIGGQVRRRSAIRPGLDVAGPRLW